MPEPSPSSDMMADAQRYIAMKQNFVSDAVGSEVPPEKSDYCDPDHHHHQGTIREEQKVGPIMVRPQPQQPHTLKTPTPTSNIPATAASAAIVTPTPSSPSVNLSAATLMPPPSFSFGSYANRSEWNVNRSSRPPLAPSGYHSSSSHHLHAPRPSHAYDHHHHSSSRMRGDGFLLDEEDEPEGLDLSNSSDNAPLPIQLQRAASTGTEEEDELFGQGILMTDGVERPRSAGPSCYSANMSTTLARSNTGDSNVSSSSALPPLHLVCPSCGVQHSAEAEQSFHAHVTRCFLLHRSVSETNGSNASSSSSGPIRKRGRASSAAASTGIAAELASALAKQQSAQQQANGEPKTPTETHGYHPYSGAQPLSSTLRQLRKTVEQLDLHQRISIMEAFHRLSRVALVEQQHAQHSAHNTPRNHKLRSATNSPSPKHKPEDKLCSNIMSLLYSPRLTAPHPSPSCFRMSNLQIGSTGSVISGSSAASVDQTSVSSSMDESGSDSGIRSIMSSPIQSMDTLELGAVHTPTNSSKSYMFSPEPASEFTPNGIMTDIDETTASNLAAPTSALALNAQQFGAGLNSGATSPASPISNQTSPSVPDRANETASNPIPPPQFPTHCGQESLNDGENTTLQYSAHAKGKRLHERRMETPVRA